MYVRSDTFRCKLTNLLFTKCCDSTVIGTSIFKLLSLAASSLGPCFKVLTVIVGHDLQSSGLS